jgi:hypothetical protein
MTPQELMSSFMAQQTGAGEPPKFEMPLKDAQRHELAIIREQMTDRCRPEVFVQWDEVTQVHRTGSITPDAASRAVFVFWRYISIDDAFRRLDLMRTQAAVALFFAATPDCLIAWLSPEGLRFEIADSSLLVKVEDPMFAEVGTPPTKPIEPEQTVGIGGAPLGSRLSIIRAKSAGFGDGKNKNIPTLSDGFKTYCWPSNSAEALSYAEGYGEGRHLLHANLDDLPF